MFTIGKSEKGTVVHAINKSGENNHALCDKRQHGLIADATMDMTAITCSKCLQYADVKKALADLMTKKPVTNASEKPKESAGIPVHTPKKREKKKRGGKSDKAKEEPKYREAEELEENEIIQDNGDFFAKAKPDNRFKIIHKPTGKSFFDSVPEEVVLDAIINLNQIEGRWQSVDSPLPDNYITNCRKALHNAYSENNKIIPKNLLDIDEDKKKKSKKSKMSPETKTEKFKKDEKIIVMVNGKVYNDKEGVPEKDDHKAETTTPADKRQRRTIKRRTKEVEKEKRTIKRRDKKPEEKSKRKIKRRNREDTLLGRTKGSPGHTVLELLQKGITMEKLLIVLEGKHGLAKKKAWTKIRAVIRKTSRRQNVPVSILMKGNPSEDVYQIAQLKKGS